MRGLRLRSNCLLKSWLPLLDHDSFGGKFNLVVFMMQLTIIGFGNQAKAWSKNLRDSGYPLRVALRPDSPSLDEAVQAGFDVVEIGSPDFYQGRAFALLTPDHTHHEFMQTHGHLFPEGTQLLYAHGYSLLKNRFNETFPRLSHILFAPKSIGSELRNQYLLKGKLGAVYSLEFARGNLEQVEAELRGLARALGINMGPFKTSFERETRADLYSEQGLLCSLVPYAAKEMFETMVADGIEPELAYFECWFELKLIVAAMVDNGPKAFFDLISPNALVGAEKGSQRLMTDEFKANLRSLYTEIKNGTFDAELDKTQISELREQIRKRWEKSPLVSTHEKLQGLK